MSKKKEEQNQPEQRITDLESQLKRAVADYQNLEKRVAEGRSELTKWGTGELLVKLLPTLDHLEQALKGVKESNEAESQSGWFKGVEMAVKELQSVLQSEGLEQIVTEGQFNPHLQEAVDTELGDDNIILKVVRKGYTLNGKVLRPAAVVVGRRHSGEEQSDDARINESEDSGQVPMDRDPDKVGASPADGGARMTDEKGGMSS